MNKLKIILFVIFLFSLISILLVIGDSKDFITGTDVLSIGELIGTVKVTFTSNDLEGLLIGTLDTGLGTTPVRQYLTFDNTTASVVYEYNNSNASGHWLKFPANSYLFDYELEFTTGAISSIGVNGELDDLEDNEIFILDDNFTIIKVERLSGDGISLAFLGGEISDTLRDGEVKTYSIGGVFYEVTLVYTDYGANKTSRFSVNGNMGNNTGEGESYSFFNGNLTMAVRQIYTDGVQGLVDFYIGNKKLELTDTLYTDTVFSSQTVIYNDEVVGNAELIIKGVNQTNNTQLMLQYFRYKTKTTTDIYVPLGSGLRAQLSQPIKMLIGGWNITYECLANTGVSQIKLIPVANHSYNFSFQNLNGDNYTFHILTNKSDSDIGFKYGDSSSDFIFKEPFTASQLVEYYNSSFISLNDSFVVSTVVSPNNSAVTNVLKYTSINITNKTLSFQDYNGDNLLISYIGTPGINATGDLIVSGATHPIWVSNQSRNYSLSIDLDAYENVSQGEVNIVVNGGGMIDLGTQTFDAQKNPSSLGSPVNMVLTTLNTDFDESEEGNETVNITVYGNGVNSIYATVDGTLYEDNNNSNYTRRLNSYGILIEKYALSHNQTSPQITIDYPLSQRYARVYVTTLNLSANQAPNITVISNIIVNETALINITDYYNVTDDSPSLSYNYTSPINGSGLWQTTFNDSGEYTCTVTVSDGQINSIADISITVLDLPDLDNDGNPDYNDTDDDNDGFNDSIDRVRGNASYVSSDTLTAINVTINGTDNLTQLFNDTFNITLRNGSKLLVEFVYNLTSSVLALHNITIDVQNDSTAGSLLIKGLVLQENNTKTLYVDKISSSINSICIEDAPIDSISEISALCNGDNETPLTCPGVSGNYNCSLVNANQTYKMTGLSYSGVKQQTYCGDGTCNGAETCSNCQTDCGVCSDGSSGGGGGGGIAYDDERYWICGNWSKCVDGGQIQNCTHKFRSNTEKINERDCNVTTSEEPEETVKENETIETTQTIEENVSLEENMTSLKEEEINQEETQGKKKFLVYIMLGVVLMLVLAIGVFIFMKKKKLGAVD
ncbi:hypothetical protein KY348_01835 [Candidatus Woesearchaeota archaeon]|nr:hypothetical protein [Candidatus Woesearchaeota archaeon]